MRSKEEWWVGLFGVLPYIFYIVNGTNFGYKIGSLYITIGVYTILFLLSMRKPSAVQGISLGCWCFSFYLLFLAIVSFEFRFAYIEILMIQSIVYFQFIGFSEKYIKTTALFYGIISFVFAVDYGVGGITAHWNSNSVGMVIATGVLFWGFVRAINKKKGRIRDYFFILATLLILEITDCRSGMLSIVLFVGFLLFFSKAIERRWFHRLFSAVVLLVPIFIVNLIIGLYSSPWAQQLNEISLKYTDKLFFSGREDIWIYMYNKMGTGLTMLFGQGAPIVGNSHSLYMEILWSTGIVGLVLYLLVLWSVYRYLYRYIQDKIVKLSIFMFSAVYLMQTFESIMFSVNGINIIPYIILSIGLGRSLYLKKLTGADQGGAEGAAAVKSRAGG